MWLLQPAWMIPPIGICMASGSAHELRLPGPVDLFFYLALLFFLVLFPAIIYRWHFWPKVCRCLSSDAACDAAACDAAVAVPSLLLPSLLLRSDCSSCSALASLLSLLLHSGS